MSKQKIVIRLGEPNDKNRSKDMQLASKSVGVNWVAITGDAKDRLEVVGESIDIACLINHLRKKVCRAGVNSVAITGDAKDRLEVVGESIDIACLINHLRKKVCHAEIVVVEEVKDEKKEEEKKKEEEEKKKKAEEELKKLCTYPPPCTGYLPPAADGFLRGSASTACHIL